MSLPGFRAKAVPVRMSEKHGGITIQVATARTKRLIQRLINVKLGLNYKVEHAMI